MFDLCILSILRVIILIFCSSINYNLYEINYYLYLCMLIIIKDSNINNNKKKLQKRKKTNIFF